MTELGTSPRWLPAECGMFSLAETRRNLDISLAPFFGVEFWRLGALIGSNYCPERTGLLLMNTHRHVHTQTQAHMCTHTHEHTDIHIYKDTSTHTKDKNTYTHTYIYTYICTHVHTHT